MFHLGFVQKIIVLLLEEPLSENSHWGIKSLALLRLKCFTLSFWF